MINKLKHKLLNLRYKFLKPRGERVQEAFLLKQSRKIDARNGKGYRISFNAGLKDLNTAYGQNLPTFIKKLSLNKPQFKVLEIGCGSGRGAVELMDACPSIDLHATGVKRISQWVDKRINWHVASAEKISYIFRKKTSVQKFDFVHSNLGIINSQNVNHALVETAKILKTGGHFLFTLNYSRMPIPQEYTLISKTQTQINGRELTAYLLKRV